MYNDGASEESLGQALGGVRHKAVICSKVSPAHAYRRALRDECEHSLRNLRTDYIDLYMIHWPINPMGIRHFTEDETVLANPPNERRGLIYNKTMFEEKGYQIPYTQEELVALMDQMLADEIIPIATEGTPHGGKVEYVRRSLMDYLLLDAGIIETEEHLNARLLDYQGLRGESAEMTREWYKNGYFGENPFGTEREEAQTLFFSGKAGLLWCNNNELTDLRALESQFGIEIDSFQWPAPKGAGVTIGYAGMNDGFAAWSGTKYPDQAADLLKGLTMMDVQTLWGDKANSIMCVQNISYSDSLLVKWSEEFSDMTRFVVAADYNAGTQDDDVSDVFVDFMLSDMTPDQYEARFVEIRTNSIADAEGND